MSKIKQYKILTHELEWHDCEYIIEAESEEEAIELIDSGIASCESDTYYATDRIEIDNIEVL